MCLHNETMIVPYNHQFQDWKQKRKDDKIIFYDKKKSNFVREKKRSKRSDVENAPGHCSVHATGLLTTVLSKFLLVF